LWADIAAWPIHTCPAGQWQAPRKRRAISEVTSTFGASGMALQALRRVNGAVQSALRCGLAASEERVQQSQALRGCSGNAKPTGSDHRGEWNAGGVMRVVGPW
jgi:hypothetical protein